MKPDTPSPEAYVHAAWLLGCEPAALQAIAEVEAGSAGAFLDSGEPVILYEPHVFHRLTGGRFDGKRVSGVAAGTKWAQLSFREWQPGTYGPTSVQHQRLAAAALLDRDAALQSCSWGLFQILPTPGTLFCGFGTLQRFVNAMYGSADDHLRALVFFVRLDGRLVEALRAKDWTAFAATYNGPQHERNRYAPRIADAYARLAPA